MGARLAQSPSLAMLDIENQGHVNNQEYGQCHDVHCGASMTERSSQSALPVIRPGIMRDVGLRQDYVHITESSRRKRCRGAGYPTDGSRTVTSVPWPASLVIEIEPP